MSQDEGGLGTELSEARFIERYRETVIPRIISSARKFEAQDYERFLWINFGNGEHVFLLPNGHNTLLEDDELPYDFNLYVFFGDKTHVASHDHSSEDQSRMIIRFKQQGFLLKPKSYADGSEGLMIASAEGVFSISSFSDDQSEHVFDKQPDIDAVMVDQLENGSGLNTVEDLIGYESVIKLADSVLR